LLKILCKLLSRFAANVMLPCQVVANPFWLERLLAAGADDHVKYWIYYKPCPQSFRQWQWQLQRLE
jgi:hypothetical protein